jgi:hypothetical protein
MRKRRRKRRPADEGFVLLCSADTAARPGIVRTAAALRAKGQTWTPETDTLPDPSRMRSESWGADPAH